VSDSQVWVRQQLTDAPTRLESPPARPGGDGPRPQPSRPLLALAAVAAVILLAAVVAGWPQPTVAPNEAEAAPPITGFVDVDPPGGSERSAPAVVPAAVPIPAPDTFPTRPWSVSTALGRLTWQEVVLPGAAVAGPIALEDGFALVTEAEPVRTLWRSREGNLWVPEVLADGDAFGAGDRVTGMADLHGRTALLGESARVPALWIDEDGWGRDWLPVNAIPYLPWSPWRFGDLLATTPSSEDPVLLFAPVLASGVDWNVLLDTGPTEWIAPGAAPGTVERLTVSDGVARRYGYDVSLEGSRITLHVWDLADDDVVVRESFDVPFGTGQKVVAAIRRQPRFPVVVGHAAWIMHPDRRISPIRGPVGSLHAAIDGASGAVLVGNLDARTPAIWRGSPASWEPILDLDYRPPGRLDGGAHRDGTYLAVGSSFEPIAVTDSIAARTKVTAAWISAADADAAGTRTWQRVDTFPARRALDGVRVATGHLGWVVTGQRCRFSCALELRVSPDGTDWDLLSLGDADGERVIREQLGAAVGDDRIVVVSNQLAPREPTTVIWVARAG
jgi:hypothetical protein